MNAKHRRTLAAVYATPVPRNIAYRDLAALLTAMGCAMKQGDGSRVEFLHGDLSLHVHEPHPGKEIKPYQVKRARMFLAAIGVEP